MQDKEFTDVQIKSLLEEYVQNTSQCGLEAFIVTKNAPKLRRMSFAEQKTKMEKTLEQY